MVHTIGRRGATGTDNMTVRDSIDNIDELVEEVCIMMEYWRMLVMSCRGVHWSSVSKYLDYQPLLVTHLHASHSQDLFR
ncbi:MAG: hypothetical protein ACTSV8_00450 [Candidatus Thorarchaeota archaeon]